MTQTKPIDYPPLPTEMPGMLNGYTTDFGLKKRYPGRGKIGRLTQRELEQVLGANDAVKMTFVPQMLSALALRQVTLLINYCCEHRVAAMKKHTRVMRKCVEEYIESIAGSYGDAAYASYLHYVGRLVEQCSGDIWLMELHADELCRNQLPDCKHREIAKQAIIALQLISLAYLLDDDSDKLLTQLVGMPTRRQPDRYMELIRAMCISIGEDLGYELTPDAAMSTWGRVIANKAWALADDIIREEHGVDNP